MSIFSPTAKHVTCNTSECIDEKIENKTHERAALYEQAEPEELYERLSDLECEWDTERVMGTGTAGLVIAGLVLGLTQSRAWFALTGAAGLLMLLHALGVCPPLPLIRRFGIRTANEINHEKELIEQYL